MSERYFAPDGKVGAVYERNRPLVPGLDGTPGNPEHLAVLLLGGKDLKNNRGRTMNRSAGIHAALVGLALIVFSRHAPAAT